MAVSLFQCNKMYLQSHIIASPIADPVKHVKCGHCDCAIGGKKLLLRGPVPVTSDSLSLLSPQTLNDTQGRSKRKVIEAAKPVNASKQSPPRMASPELRPSPPDVVSRLVNPAAAEVLVDVLPKPINQSRRLFTGISTDDASAALPGCVNEEVLPSLLLPVLMSIPQHGMGARQSSRASHTSRTSAITPAPIEEALERLSPELRSPPRHPVVAVFTVCWCLYHLRVC